ncbi:MAG: acyloxyacyl hydrolase [Acidithiobacillales bacterium]
MTVRLLLALVLLPSAVRAADDELWPLGRKSISVAFMAGQTFTHSPGGFSETVVPDLEAGRFVSARLELGIELHPLLWIGQPQTPDGTGHKDVLAVAADGILRWYPAPLGPKIAPYGEIALGLCGSPDRIPAAGTRVNFLVQAGAGLVLRTGKRWSTVVGWRWVHISNGNFGESNPGVNFSVLLLGGRLFFP